MRLLILSFVLAFTTSLLVRPAYATGRAGEDVEKKIQMSSKAAIASGRSILAALDDDKLKMEDREKQVCYRIGKFEDVLSKVGENLWIPQLELAKSFSLQLQNAFNALDPVIVSSSGLRGFCGEGASFMTKKEDVVQVDDTEALKSHLKNIEDKLTGLTNFKFQ